VQEQAVGADSMLGWAGIRPFDSAETHRLRQVARFAAAPLATLAARAALTALLEAYLGRRSAARVQAGALGRGAGETIRAALLYADLRGFTAMSEATEPAVVITALDAWFDRIAGAVHAFGGEVLKFIGDGVLDLPGHGRAGCGLRCGAARDHCCPRRHGASRCGARGARTAAAAVRRGSACRRNLVGQYRRRRPARFHRHRFCGQSR
jgi:class 3 adenylate cyclase